MGTTYNLLCVRIGEVMMAYSCVEDIMILWLRSKRVVICDTGMVIYGGSVRFWYNDLS